MLSQLPMRKAKSVIRRRHCLAYVGRLGEQTGSWHGANALLLLDGRRQIVAAFAHASHTTFPPSIPKTSIAFLQGSRDLR